MPSRGEGLSSRASTRALALPHAHQRKEKHDILGGMRTSRTHHVGFRANNGAPILKIKTIDIDFDNTKTHLDTHGSVPVVNIPSYGSKDPIMHIGVPLKVDDPEHEKHNKKEPSAPVAEFEPYPLQHRRLCPLPRNDGQYYTYQDKTVEEYENEVEYTMDEEDWVWLEQCVNSTRKKKEKVSDVIFEACMDRLEKFSYRNNHEDALHVDDEAVCVICQDGDTEAGNAILFCDYCNIPVHQDCYGVVLIPEGQWLCRRCSVCADGRLVSGACKLCPSKGGAFKQTMDGEWMHVICAMWIPEVHFGNDQYLEPIMDVDKIPAARWKLKCYICGLNNAGACIQCSTKTCYAAYHATCARTANLYMKMCNIPESYCDAHSPKDWGATLVSTIHTTTGRPKVLISATLKKLLIESGVGVSAVAVNDAVPLVAVPTVPLKEMSAFLAGYKDKVHGKADFLKKVMPYWFLKRKSRSGVPLLRRLHTAFKGEDGDALDVEVLDGGGNKLKQRIQKLRIVLERLRILAEFTVRRERLKKELVTIQRSVTLKRLCPLVAALSQLLDSLRKLDTRAFFHYPVDVQEVEDYLDTISHPMDFATMGRKVENLEYCTLDQFQADFELIITNATTYNAKKSPYYKEALSLKRKASPLFTALHDKLLNFHVHPNTGLLLPAGVEYHAETEEYRKGSQSTNSTDAVIKSHPAVVEIPMSTQSTSSTAENNASDQIPANGISNIPNISKSVIKPSRDPIGSPLKNQNTSLSSPGTSALDAAVKDQIEAALAIEGRDSATMTRGMDSEAKTTTDTIPTVSKATEHGSESIKRAFSRYPPKTKPSLRNSFSEEPELADTTQLPKPSLGEDGKTTLTGTDRVTDTSTRTHTAQLEANEGNGQSTSTRDSNHTNKHTSTVAHHPKPMLSGSSSTTADTVLFNTEPDSTQTEGKWVPSSNPRVSAEKRTAGTDKSGNSDNSDNFDKPSEELHTVEQPSTRNLRHNSSRPPSRPQSAQSFTLPNQSDTPASKRSRPASDPQSTAQNTSKRPKISNDPQSTRKGRRTRSQPTSPRPGPIPDVESILKSQQKAARDGDSGSSEKTFSPLATRRQRSHHAPTRTDNKSEDRPSNTTPDDVDSETKDIRTRKTAGMKSVGKGKTGQARRRVVADPTAAAGKKARGTVVKGSAVRVGKSVRSARAQTGHRPPSHPGNARKGGDKPGLSDDESWAEKESSAEVSDESTSEVESSDAGSDFEPNVKMEDFSGVEDHVRTRGSLRTGTVGSNTGTSLGKRAGTRGSTGTRGVRKSRGKSRKSARTSGTNTAEPTPKRIGKR